MHVSPTRAEFDARQAESGRVIQLPPSGAPKSCEHELHPKLMSALGVGVVGERRGVEGLPAVLAAPKQGGVRVRKLDLRGVDPSAGPTVRRQPTSSSRGGTWRSRVPRTRRSKPRRGQTAQRRGRTGPGCLAAGTSASAGRVPWRRWCRRRCMRHRCGTMGACDRFRVGVAEGSRWKAAGRRPPPRRRRAPRTRFSRRFRRHRQAGGPASSGCPLPGSRGGWARTSGRRGRRGR